MIEITREIKVLLGDNKGKFPFSNSLFIDDEARVLVDTGCGSGPEAKRAVQGLDAVIFSHYHLDHTRGAASLERPLYCHPGDIPPLEDRETLLHYTSFGELGEAGARQILEFLQYRPLRVTGSFSDGEELDFGRTRWRVIHTPGHSPGHCCFFEEKEGVLFSADIDLDPFGPWYGHNSCELDAFEASIKKLMALKPRLIISGHSPPLKEGGVPALAKYLMKITKREEMILNYLENPASLDEVTDRRFIYGRHPEPVFLYRHFEKKMIQKHLDRFFTRGEVQVEGDRYRRVKKRQKFFYRGKD